MTWGNAKDLAEVIALSAAAIFFLYKLISGYLIINLTMKVDCERRAINSNKQDILAITVQLSKGDRGSLEIHDATINVECEDRTQEVELLGFRRSTYRPRDDYEKYKKVNWGVQSNEAPFLRLTPGEETQLAAKCLVPKDKPCAVQAVVLGKRTKGWKVGQWKAACVSLPITQA